MAAFWVEGALAVLLAGERAEGVFVTAAGEVGLRISWFLMLLLGALKF